jgi:hypothetical protein
VSTALVLGEAVRRLSARLAALAAEIDAAPEAAGSARWREYAETAEALGRLWRLVEPVRPPALVKTRDLAKAMGVSERTVRRHRKAGRLTPAVELGTRTIRWRTPGNGRS